MSLYDDVTARIADPRISALIVEEEMEPTKGAGAVIAPPTYSGARGEPPKFAASMGLVPTRSASGWHHDHRVIDNRALTEARVVVNSIGACADRAETALYRNQDRVGLRLPAVILTGLVRAESESPSSSETADRIDSALAAARRAQGKDAAQADAGTSRRQVMQALSFRLSSWELAHRLADSWLMYAQHPAGSGQVWVSDGQVKRVLLDMAHEFGDNVYSHGPNVALYGNWLSAGTARRHAVPRAYSCEVTGFGAHAVDRGATKLDPTGGTTNKSRVLLGASNGVVLGAKGLEPSKLGFGQVPSTPATRGYQCELILRQASVSLKALSRFSYDDDQDRAKARAASRVYVLLAIAGHLLAQEDGFLRSECDLLTVEERWGWRQHGSREPQPMATPTLDDAAEALRRAVGDAERQGLRFADPIELTLSDAQVGLIVERVLVEGSKFDQGTE